MFVALSNAQLGKRGGFHGSDNQLYPMANRINKVVKAGQ